MTLCSYKQVTESKFREGCSISISEDFLFGSFFTVCYPYIDVHFLKCFFMTYLYYLDWSLCHLQWSSFVYMHVYYRLINLYQKDNIDIHAQAKLFSCFCRTNS